MNAFCVSALLAVSVAISVCPVVVESAPQVVVGGILDGRYRFGFENGIIYHNTRKNSTQHNFVAYALPTDLRNTFNVTRELCKLYRQKSLLTGGHSSLVSLRTFRAYANNFLIPYVTASLSKTDMGIRSDERDFLVSIMPSLVQPLEDLIRYHKWEKFAYIYSGEEALQRYQTLSSRLSPKKYDIELRQVGDKLKTRELLKSFRDSGRHRIVCDTVGNDSVVILSQASVLGMITQSYHFIFLDLDISDANMDFFLYGGMNVTGFQLMNKTNENYLILQKKWSKIRANKTSRLNGTQDLNPLYGYSDNSIKTLTALAYDVTRVFAKTTELLERYGCLPIFRAREARPCSSTGITGSRHDYDLLKYTKQVQFRSITGLIAFDANGERTNHTLQVLGLRPTGLEEVGIWDQSANPRLKLYGVNGQNRSRDLNKTIIVTTVLESPFVMMKHPKESYTGNDRYEGYCVDLLAQINEHHKFKFEIRARNDSKYGAMDANGNWDGMILELIKGDADIALAPLTINSDRERVIDFTKPYMSLGVSIMIKKPQNTRPSVFSFLHPLSYEIWLSIIFAYLGVSVVLFLVSRFSPDEWYTVEQGTLSCAPSTEGDIDRVEPRDKKENNFGIQNSLWFSMGALMQQGCEVSPRCLSGRIVGGVWWFFTLIIISSYTANLAAFLTVERMSSPINSAEDLVNRKDISYGIQRSGATEQFFSSSNTDIYQRMWQRINTTVPSPMTDSAEEGISRVRHSNGKYVFMLESTMNEYQNQQKPCDTMKVGSNLDSKSYGIGVTRERSLLRDELTLAILQLGEDGVLDTLKKKWWYDKGECGVQSDSVDQANALSLSNVAGIFYILIVGMGVAMFVAISEFYWRSRAQSNKEKVSLSHALKAKIRMSVTGEKGMPTYPIMRPVNQMACEKALLPRDKESPALIKRGQTSV
ncbi:glutamate receptor 4-like [Diadema antillarum]|uniref:glutamate receptor 4-like n=1 Tax=Diadema antillarum TaxID=105358 RepID=UPI003A863C94